LRGTIIGTKQIVHHYPSSFVSGYSNIAGFSCKEKVNAFNTLCYAISFAFAILYSNAPAFYLQLLLSSLHLFSQSAACADKIRWKKLRTLEAVRSVVTACVPEGSDRRAVEGFIAKHNSSSTKP